MLEDIVLASMNLAQKITKKIFHMTQPWHFWLYN